jgi:hypothetical protein
MPDENAPDDGLNIYEEMHYSLREIVDKIGAEISHHFSQLFTVVRIRDAYFSVQF